MTVVGRPANQPDPESTEVPPEPDAAARAAAEAAGLDYDAIPADEREFVVAVEAGVGQATRGQHPLIPGADENGDPIDPASAGATTDDAGEEGIRPVSDASSGGAGQDEPTGAPAAAIPPADAVPPVTPPAVATPPAEATMVTIGGVEVPLEYAQYALGVAQQLSPEEIEHLNAVREGRAGFAFIDPGTGQPVAPAAPANIAPTAPPADALPPADEWVDPVAAQAFARLQAEIQGVAHLQQQTMEQQLESQRAAIMDGLAVGAEEFRSDHNLEQAELDQLITAVNTAGILPGYANLHRGNHTAAMKAALNAAYWSTDSFRDAAIQAAISEHVTENRATEEKKAKAAGLNPSTGNVPRTSPPPTSQRQRDDAMVADIAAAMQQSTTT